MTNRIIAMLLAIALAACSSVPRLAPAGPRGPVDAAASSSASAKDGAASDSKPEQKSADSTPANPDSTPPTTSHLTEIGSGLVLVALVALMVWLNYRLVCPYCW